MNPAYRSLIFAFGASALLHAGLLTGLPKPVHSVPLPPNTPPAQAYLEASLRPLPVPEAPPPLLALEDEEAIRGPAEPEPKPAQPVNKKTVASPSKKQQLISTQNPQAPALPGTLPPSATQEAMRQLKRMAQKQGFYPEEAIRQGWQGEVLVQIFLDTNGHVVAARVEHSSGYPVLDEAALRATRTLKGLPAQGVEEAFLPVTFRLE